MSSCSLFRGTAVLCLEDMDPWAAADHTDCDTHSEYGYVHARTALKESQIAVVQAGFGVYAGAELVVAAWPVPQSGPVNGLVSRLDRS